MRVLLIASLDPRQRYRFIVSAIEAADVAYDVFYERVSFFSTLIRLIHRLVKTSKPEVTILIGGDIRNFIWFLILRIFSNAKIILRFGGDPVDVRLSRQENWIRKGAWLSVIRSKVGIISTKYLLRHVDGAIFVSKYLANKVKPMMSLSSSVIVVPPILKIEPGSKSLSHDVCRLKLLTVANLNYSEKAEGVTTLIKVLDDISANESGLPHIEYDIVGGGERLLWLREFVESRNPSKNFSIKLHGFRQDVNQFYSRADIFLYLSTLDAYSLPLVEAQAHGLPIVVNRWGPFPELFEGDEGVLFFDTERIDMLRGILMAVFTDQSLRTKMSAANIKRFEYCQSLSRTNEELHDFFLSLVTSDK